MIIYNSFAFNIGTYLSDKCCLVKTWFKMMARASSEHMPSRNYIVYERSVVFLISSVVYLLVIILHITNTEPPSNLKKYKNVRKNNNNNTNTTTTFLWLYWCQVCVANGKYDLYASWSKRRSFKGQRSLAVRIVIIIMRTVCHWIEYL